MNYVNGLRVTLSAYRILTAGKRETTRLALARRLEASGLLWHILTTQRRNARRVYQTVAVYELTILGRQVADELRREAQRGNQ